ncbi:MAG: glycosyltransferase family 9 protein [Candidatus Cloacimonetes bacterium]|nr:glycosyltransferase family 9 protein [Candidatus Cloacimonadota bacterium]
MKLPSNPKNILIIRLGAIGDVIQTLPAIQQIQLNYPNAKIHWAIEDKSYPVVKHQANMEFILFPKKKIFNVNPFVTLYNNLKFRKKLKALNFDLVFDFQGLFKSGWLSMLTGSKHKIGFNKANTRELNHLFHSYTIPEIPEKVMHRVDFYQKLLFDSGLTQHKLEDPFNFQFLPSEVKGFRDLIHRLRIRMPYIIINVGASKATKRWKTPYFIEVIKKLKEKHPKHRILLTGGGNEDYLTSLEILKELKPGTCQTAINKTTLIELALLVKKCSFLLSGDTLALHLASAFKVPSIGLFGGSALAVETKPYWDEYPGLDCGGIPCYPCRKKTCSHHSCMTYITPQQVLSTIDQISF